MSFPPSLTPQTLFYTAALLNAVSAPGHVLMGVSDIYKSISSIPGTRSLAIGKQGARNCWDYVTGSLVVLALLNYQWARTGGPVTNEEKLIVWISAVAGAWSGWGYIKVGAYGPLGCMIVAPVCSLGGMLMM